MRPETTEFLATNELIETVRHERIEQLYYDEYPPNIKELMVRPNIVSELTGAYARGGDDYYRFNLIVILNHRAALDDTDKAALVQCLETALDDEFSWVRTEAVWGIGLFGARRSIPRVISLLDDPDSKVVNEAVLTLAKLTGSRDLPISNRDMSEAERQQAVEFWKGWWDKVKPKAP